MAINKVVDRNNNTLLDLTFDTVTPNKVLAGETFHDKYGNEKIGTLQADTLNTLKYNFIDYDGTLLYSYTDEELDALTSLPAGPDHTGENLTFQGWNWNLEDLKVWNRERTDRPIVGAHYITTDGKSYVYLDTPLTGASLQFSVNNSSNLQSVDWGDGTIDTSFSSNTIKHTYENPGEYIIVIDMSDGYWYFGNYSVSTSTNKQYVKYIKLGTMTFLDSAMFYYLFCVNSITIPASVTSIGSIAFRECTSLKSVTIPDSVTSIGAQTFYNCTSLTSVTIPNSVTSISANVFQNCYSLTSIVIPDSVTSIGSTTFSECRSLTSVVIPDSVTSLGMYAFQNCPNLKSVIIGNSVTTIGDGAFSGCYCLTSVTIPDSLTSIDYQAFQYCYSLTSVVIPASVTSIGSNAFQSCKILILDISEQTKVIPLSNSIGISTSSANRILIPQSLLDQYKTASYWSNYADYMVGV